MKTRILFRVFPEGDVIALFPEQVEYNPSFVNSYQHMGQHSAAHVDLIRELRCAKPSEYKPLLSELRQIGYTNIVVGRKAR